LASKQYPSGMATVFYGPDSQVGKACTAAKEWCLERGVDNPECAVANFLYPHCKVVAGSLEALDFLEKNGKQFKLRKVKRLSVSGGFHTKLMESAVEPFKNALKKIELEPPMIRVYSNVDGKVYRNTDHILRQLPSQIVKPVRWEQLLHIIYERPQGDEFPRTFELAPGNTLTTILKNVNAKAHSHAYPVDSDLVKKFEDENVREAERRQ
jgi:[acyl-carrier-protein] S-malonyltransferase